MPLPISLPYTFANATAAIPLANLDSDLTTLRDGINGIGNGTNALSNVVITGGTIDGTTIGATTSSTGRFSTVTATTGNITTVNATTTNSATVRADGNLTFQSNGTTTAMTIDTSQNVGIGTASPAGRLEVSSANNILYSTGTAGFGSFYARGSGTNASYLFMGNATSGEQGRITTENTGIITFANTASATERMRINASGNVGIGTSSPTEKLDVSGNIAAGSLKQNTTTNAFNNFVANGGTTTNSGFTGVFNSSGTRIAYLGFWDGNNIVNMVEGNFGLTFGTNNAERARIDTSGNFLFGVTADPSNSGNNGASFYKATNNYEMHSRSGVTTTSYVGIFYNPNGTVGSISTNGSATTYSTLSDYRLKYDVQPVTTGLATVSALKPVTYKWNADNSDGEGFIAHELQEVIPHAVTGEKDAVDEDGNPRHQGVDYSKIVVHLVAAIQELKAELDAAKARIATLEKA
jgi:hypothetical protein